MDDLMKNLSIGGGGGILGVVSAWISFRTQISDLKKDLEGLKKRVRFRDTCDEIIKRMETSLGNILHMQEEMRNDIKKILAQKK